MTTENIHPWFGLWVQPRKTLRAILDRDPRRVILWLAIIAGAISGLSWVSYTWYRYPDRPEVHNYSVIIAALIGGALLGVAHLYLMGWLLKITGGWIGGKGDFIALKCAVGWSNYPFIISNIFSFISALVAPNPWLQSFFGLLNVIAAVWGIVIYMKLIGEAHRFSAWRGVAAFMLATLLILAALTLVSLLVPLLSPLFV